MNDAADHVERDYHERIEPSFWKDGSGRAPGLARYSDKHLDRTIDSWNIPRILQQGMYILP